MGRETRREHDFVDFEMADPVGRTPVHRLQPELLDHPGESNVGHQRFESFKQLIATGESTRILVDSHLETIHRVQTDRQAQLSKGKTPLGRILEDPSSDEQFEPRERGFEETAEKHRLVQVPIGHHSRKGIGIRQQATDSEHVVGEPVTPDTDLRQAS